MRLKGDAPPRRKRTAAVMQVAPAGRDRLWRRFQVMKIFCRCKPLSARPYTNYKVLLVRPPAPGGPERSVT
jgi:hypothetical protein